MAAISVGPHYRPSLLVWLCLIAAYKILRFNIKTDTTLKSTEHETV